MSQNLLKPNLFVIGGMRCGTTAICQILGNHNKILLSDQKEPNYFKFKYISLLSKTDQIKYSKWLKRKKKYTNEKEYLSLFKSKNDYKYRVEGSIYLNAEIGVAKLIKRDTQNAKIIISVRNPIERFHSHFLFNVRTNKIANNINKFYKENYTKFLNNEVSAIGSGFYIDKIEKWKGIFGDDNVYVIKYEDFKKHSDKTVKDLLAWLNLPEIDYKELKSNPQKTGEIKYKKFFYFLNSNKLLKFLIKLFFSKSKIRKIKEYFFNLFIGKKKNMPKELIKKLELIYAEELVKIDDFFKKI